MKDVFVIGSGPNGLAAAIELQGAGAKVCLVEQSDTLGGGLRTEVSTLPGFLHDVCSAVHPLALASPFFRKADLSNYGLRWVVPEIAVAHPFDSFPAAFIRRSIAGTAGALDSDGRAYARFFNFFSERAEPLLDDVLGPLSIPGHPFLLSAFGATALPPASLLARTLFRGERARALFAGNAAHAFQPLDHALTSAIGILLIVTAHRIGWPVPVGGARSIAEALVRRFRDLGGEIRTGFPVTDLGQLPKAAVKVFDTSPHRMADICGSALQEKYARRLREYRYGPAAYKIDYAMSAPIPWADPVLAGASTVHLGGEIEEIEDAERSAWDGRVHERPFLLVSQPTAFDATRAPEGRHTAWIYAHVPHATRHDFSRAIENQLERFAPGFGERVLARHVTTPQAFERGNPNLVGGDIVGGVQDLRQAFHRPVGAVHPYATSHPDIFICSASTPPGAGVHGMCGYHAAQLILRRGPSEIG